MRSIALDDRERRRRARNWALLIALAGLAFLFYVVTIVRIGAGP
jgi:hypothetical protein